MTAAEKFARLYNASKPQGLGLLHFTPAMMTIKEATEVLSQSSYIDYHRGRVIKVDFAKAEPNYGLYDRDLGPGAALRALADPNMLAPSDR